MVQQIQVGNDTLEFPDDMSDDQITAVIQKEYGQGGQQQATSQAPTQSETPAQPERGIVANVAMGVPQGLGNAAIGAFQAATDVGESAARLIEKLYYGDNLKMNTFGDRLAEQVKKRNEQQAQLPTSERIGIAIGQALPYLTTGVGTGAKVAQVVGNVAGLAAGGVVGGAVSSALSPQEQAGLENRGEATAKGATVGGLVGGGLGVVGKVASSVGSGAAQLGKDILAGYKARPVETIAGFTSKPVETLDTIGAAIKEGSNNAYKAVRESGAVLKPETTKSIFTGIDDSLKESGILNPRLHGDTIGVLNDLKALAKEKNGAIGLEELDQYRQLLGDVVKKNTDISGKINADALKANIAINKLDDVVENTLGKSAFQTPLSDSSKINDYFAKKLDEVSKRPFPNGGYSSKEMSNFSNKISDEKLSILKDWKEAIKNMPQGGQESVKNSFAKKLDEVSKRPFGDGFYSREKLAAKLDGTFDEKLAILKNQHAEDLRINNLQNNSRPEALDLLNTARSEWQRYRKFDTITNIVRKADGDPNRTKTLLQNFVNNPKNLRGFTEAEVEALKRAKTNSTAEGLMKAMGKFGFDIGSGRNAGNSALPIGSILLGGGTGGLTAAVGTIARQAQKLSARGQIDDVLKLIQGQEPQIASKVVQKLPPKTRDFVLTNILTQSTNQSTNQ